MALNIFLPKIGKKQAAEYRFSENRISKKGKIPSAAVGKGDYARGLMLKKRGAKVKRR